jgi:hypothetical protein
MHSNISCISYAYSDSGNPALPDTHSTGSLDPMCNTICAVCPSSRGQLIDDPPFPITFRLNEPSGSLQYSRSLVEIWRYGRFILCLGSVTLFYSTLLESANLLLPLDDINIITSSELISCLNSSFQFHICFVLK